MHTSKWSRKRRARNLVSSRKKEEPVEKGYFQKTFHETTCDGCELHYNGKHKSSTDIPLNEETEDDTHL